MEGVRRHRRLLADGLERPLELDDLVLQSSDSVHLDGHHVPGLDRPGVGGRPGQEHVAGLQRDQARHVCDLVGEREEEIASRMPFLGQLAVDVRADGEVVRIDFARVHEHGPERAEAVLPLDPEHRAAVGVAEVVNAPVVRDRVAADVGEGLTHRRAETPLADDDGDLALIVQEAAPGRACDRCAVRRDGARRLQEIRGLDRQPCHAVLDGSAAVREVRGHDLGRGDRREVARLVGCDRRSVLEPDGRAERRSPDRGAVDLDAHAPHRTNVYIRHAKENRSAPYGSEAAVSSEW